MLERGARFNLVLGGGAARGFRVGGRRTASFEFLLGRAHQLGRGLQCVRECGSVGHIAEALFGFSAFAGEVAQAAANYRGFADEIGQFVLGVLGAAFSFLQLLLRVVVAELKLFQHRVGVATA